MTRSVPRNSSVAFNDDEVWYDEIVDVDTDWAEVRVTTSDGDKVVYRVRRKPLLPAASQRPNHETR